MLLRLGYVEDKTTQKMIKKIYEEEYYLIDTHTAVAYAVYENYVQTTGHRTRQLLHLLQVLINLQKVSRVH